MSGSRYKLTSGVCGICGVSFAATPTKFIVAGLINEAHWPVARFVVGYENSRGQWTYDDNTFFDAGRCSCPLMIDRLKKDS